jgi:2-dehydro-3-deoxygalactonokinase
LPDFQLLGLPMRWKDGFIAVDWGTTNRRAYLVGPDGRCTEEFEDAKGVLSIGVGNFPPAVAEIRERLGDKPMLLAGMIGSNRGWMEAPYVRCPSGLSEIAEGIAWVQEQAGIVPGLAFVGDERADVMRGEEVQVLGAVAARLIPQDCTVCHPGTHNKWVTVRDSRIIQFRTIMTGELFNLLKQHSILSDLMGDQVELGSAFEAGARHGLANDDLNSELFALRARVLLGEALAKDAASYASGLLIGSDCRIGLRQAAPGPIVVMARPELTRLYAAVLNAADRQVVELDGERTFLAGVTRIVEMI